MMSMWPVSTVLGVVSNCWVHCVVVVVVVN
jgi:hypothetical protein